VARSQDDYFDQKIPLNVRVDRKIHGQIRQVATREGRSTSDVVREALARFLMNWNHAARGAEVAPTVTPRQAG